MVQSQGPNQEAGEEELEIRGSGVLSQQYPKTKENLKQLKKQTSCTHVKRVKNPNTKRKV